MKRRNLLKSGAMLGGAVGLGNLQQGQAAGTMQCVTERSHNHKFIGKPDSRSQLNTPALILDLDLAENNIGVMAAHCKKAGLKLRPHCKTHKCVKLAELQVKHGAIGVCAATIGEAEAMVRGVIDGILITRPVVTPEQVERLITLKEISADVMIVVDNMENVMALETANGGKESPLRLVVDMDINDHRTGCTDIEHAVKLARYINESDSLTFSGVQGYAGRAQHIVAMEERRRAVVMSNKIISELVAELTTAGLKPDIVSGGGTGTFDMLNIDNIFTELQAGSYVVMDTQYNEVWTEDNKRPPFETALFVQTVVISNNHPGFVTTDAGQKRFAKDAGQPVIAKGAPDGSTYMTAGDEHGFVMFEGQSGHAALGQRIECLTPHCDPTINLFDEYHCVRGNTLVDIWSIDARGA
ncbi:MAG: DSD1 family PLP-dependent enzyme [Gammaproteobacteria bacterium]|nr:DSD1 family PLP-dependent enzyme [Gammaproteobacteria bacterium]